MKSNGDENEELDNYVRENEESTGLMTKCEKAKYLTRAVIDVLKIDMKYPLCFAGWMVTSLVQILYGVYFLLWVTEFVHSGLITDE